MTFSSYVEARVAIATSVWKFICCCQAHDTRKINELLVCFSDAEKLRPSAGRVDALALDSTQQNSLRTQRILSCHFTSWHVLVWIINMFFVNPQLHFHHVFVHLFAQGLLVLQFAVKSHYSESFHQGKKCRADSDRQPSHSAAFSLSCRQVFFFSVYPSSGC